MVVNELSGVKISYTAPYHPMGDGQVERLNGTIINMLKNIAKEQKSRWYEHLNKLSFVYNCTRNDSTGFPHITCYLVEIQDSLLI